MSRHFSTKFYSSTLPAEDPNLWNWRNIRDSDGRLLRLESRIYVSSNESRQNSPSNIQMENMGYLSGEASSGEPLSEDALLISQNGNAHIPREVPFVAPSDEPGRPWMSDKVRLNASSPAHSFDDDVNDKDFDIDDVVRNDSDSEDHGSELEDDDFEVINQDIKDDQSTDNPKVIILSDLQLKKPNLRLTGESESSRLRKQKLLKTRHIMCVFCEENTISKNFVRHLTRRHSNEKEVQKILRQPLNCKARKQALVSLRKEITFETFLEGKTVPARRNFNDGTEESNAVDYYPCTRCKGLYKKSFLRRHVKLCMVETQTDKISSAVSRSQTFTACQLDQTNAVSRLEVKEKVFDFMRGDDIAFAAKKDLLITYFGDSYLKKHRKEKSVYTCSNKMRELGRLLIECRKLLNDQKIEMQNLLCPSHFDTIVTAARNLAGYDLVKKSFAAPSLALHYGGNLRLLCDELYHLALKDTKGFRSQTPSEKTAFLKDIKKMRQLIISRWNIEMASLANKDLQEKKWNKPLLLPLVSDIKVFREETHKITETSIAAFENDKDTQQDYKTLVECILSSLIIFNRRRIGDVQYMKVSDYKNEQKSNFKDFEDALSTTEKVLATRYRRVLNSGKGSRAVVVLIPEDIDRCIQVLLYHRHKYISEENDYLFSIPGHRVKWGRGDVAIRNLTKRMPLENPAAITSNRLRKQIATVMQILSLSKDDIKQFSNFMGHTVKTHEEFYELPVDVYQTAKVSKMLLMIENGVPVEHKGKSLAEIDIDFKYAEESGMKDLQNYYDDGLRPQEIDEDIMKGESDEEVLQVLAVNKETCTKQHLNGVESSEPSNKANLGQERKKRKKTAVDHAKNNEIGSLMDQEKNEKMEEVSRMKIRKKGKEHEEEDTENSYEGDSEIGEVSRAGNNKMKKDTKKNVAGGGQKRKGWSPKEVSLLQKRFSKCMAKNVYPSTADIRKFLDENNISRDPVSVKSKIQHLMKLKKSKK